jgi:hypothetical protein
MKMRLRTKSNVYDLHKVQKLGVDTVSAALKVVVNAQLADFQGILAKGWGAAYFTKHSLKHDASLLPTNITEDPPAGAREWVRPKHKSSSENAFYEGLYSVHLHHLLTSSQSPVDDGTMLMPEKVRIYWSTDLFTQSAHVAKDAWAFLGLEPPPNQTHWEEEIQEPVNSADAAHMHVEIPFTDREVGKMYKLFAPFDAVLAEMMGVKPPWKETADKYIAMLDE